jgi:AbiTii
MSNKELLRAIQNEAVDGSSDLSTLLRKCLVLASGLKYEPLKSWVRWELDGYPNSSELPNYRILHGLESFGIFLGAMGYQLRNAPLSLLGLPEAVRQGYSDPEVRQGVRSIVQMIRSEQEGTVSWSWPAGACQVFDLKGYRDDLRLMQAWISVPVAALVGILDAIRNRLLDFALEIENIDLGPVEQLPSEQSRQTSTAQITQVFHQTIYGPVSNVGTAETISQTMVVARGDLEGLKTRFREIGIPEPEMKELEKAIKADEAEPKPEKGHFGKNVSKWFGEMMSKAATGAIKAAPDLIATVATKALKDFCGIA